ncbi:MAG TPA: DUF2231 domain-containing protein [Flavipsychrobacter sp.]
MRSKAHFKTHPLHPILVAFPIAFFIGTLIFDLLGVFTGNVSYTTTGEYLNIAGIAGAVLAAVPGLIDFMYTVPPKSSAKKRGAQHGILNVLVLGIFVFILVYRQDVQQADWIMLGGELAGVLLLSAAGWMGGTLVHRNQIGVDIRYAGAGKWNEEYHEAGKDIKVATVTELELNQMKLVHVADKRIVIGKTERGFVAFSDYCTHRGGSLAGGALMCGTVQCPWHGSQFDCFTGDVKAGPAEESIKVYELEERDGALYLKPE